MRAGWISAPLALVAVACASLACEVWGADDGAGEDIIHSDLPLFGDDDEGRSPRPSFDRDSLGCISRVAFGDWVRRERNGEESFWYRFRNYGVFHCFALGGRSHRRDGLDGTELKPTFFVFLEEMEIDGNQRELWVAQIGARPGSEYLLLSRTPSVEIVDAFQVLQSRCPQANVRDAGAIDVVLTRYCALSTEAELIRLARRMARLPAVGTLSLVRGGGEEAR